MAKARRASGGTRARPLTSWATLAYSIGALCVATTLDVFVLEVVDLGRPGNTYVVDAFEVVMPITFAAAGALIASRLPANPIGWLFC